MAHRGRQNADSALLAALSSGCTVGEAAIAAGVGERTVYRRLEDPEFRSQLSKLKDDAITAAVSKLSNSCTQAVETLTKLLNGSSESVRLGAARSVLELAVSLRTAAELNARVTALEAKQNTRKGTGHGKH